LDNNFIGCYIETKEVSMKQFIPEGFLFSSANAGIKYENRDDLALIYCGEGAKVCGVFTKNKVKAAPVKYSQKILESGFSKIKALLINSGNANACTGAKGLKDCYEISEKLSEFTHCNSKNILIASTGVIGVELPVKKITDKFPELTKSLSVNNLENVAKAIMTTDTFPKIFSVRNDFTICGIAKGAGMINPNMATMLAFILTDADIEYEVMQKILRKINGKTFNSICVDGDTSTNDTVLLLSSGLKKNVNIEKFSDGLYEVMLNLAKMIVRDGEGATKLIKITVKGGVSSEQCKKICDALSKSLLVKTAFFGADPNWGRIICANGYSDTDIIPEKIDIFFGNYPVVERGMEAPEFSEKEISNYLADNNEINVTINLNSGNFSHECYTCDLTYEYVKINSEYRT